MLVIILNRTLPKNEKRCNSLLLDSAVGIRKMNVAPGKMPFLPSLPGQDTQASVSPWGKISKNGLYIYYHHHTPGGLCRTTAMQPDRWETTSEPLAGDSVNRKNLLCSKFVVEKDQGRHAKLKYLKSLLLPVFSMGFFEDLAVVRFFFFSISGLDLPLKFHFHTLCANLYSET